MSNGEPSDHEDEKLREIVHRNLSDTVMSSLRTLGRVVAMAIESIIGAIVDVLYGRLQWREMIR